MANSGFSRPPAVAADARLGMVHFAARIVERTDREHPADLLLRDLLRRERGLSRAAGARLSALVFDTFRWRGWLDAAQPLTEQVREAARLAERFREAPASFADRELMAKAVPGWVSEYVSVTPAWARALQSEPALWLRARAGQGSAVAAGLGDCEPAPLATLTDTWRYGGPLDLFRTPEFQAGEFEIQDLHSQAVGWLCDPRPGETWWDACAGEGGKTLHLSDRMRNQGLIWASDRAEWRLRRLKQRAARAGVFNYRAVAWDGGPKLPTKTRFDGVLVDAPCSNLGTWHRNPHARWTTTADDVRELAAVQLRLLTHAASAVKPGGKLIYAVCTLTAPETVGVTETFTRATPEFVPLALPPPFGPGNGASQVMLWPEVGGGNGMFVAAWRRR